MLSVSPFWPSCIKLHLNLILGFTNKPRNDGGLSANHTGIMTNEGQGGQNLEEGIERWMYRGLWWREEAIHCGRGEVVHREKRLFNNVVGRKNNEFPHWEIQNSTWSYDVGVWTDLHELQLMIWRCSHTCHHSFPSTSSMAFNCLWLNKLISCFGY